MVKLAARLLLLLLVMMLPACSPARPALQPQVGAVTAVYAAGDHYRYILASQRPTGAIAMTPDQASVNPYFGNLAAKALLRAPGHLFAVERYMNWYLAHLKPDGTIDDYRVKGGREVTTGDADSTDSYAATFLSLVAAWTDGGGDPGWVVRNREKLERVAGAVAAVTDRDGLTWAKPGYPQKLLMDNCEVYRGWQDWSRLLNSQGEHLPALIALRRAERVQAGLSRFRQPDGLWGWAITLDGDLLRSDGGRFYPEGVAQVFPLIWGVSDDRSGYRALDTAHPRWRGLKAGDFPWVLPAYAAALSGDRGGAREALAAVRERYGNLRWPWFIAESAWVIETESLLR